MRKKSRHSETQNILKVRIFYYKIGELSMIKKLIDMIKFSRLESFFALIYFYEEMMLSTYEKSLLIKVEVSDRLGCKLLR